MDFLKDKLPLLEEEVKRLVNKGRLGLYRASSPSWPTFRYLLQLPPDDYQLLDEQGGVLAETRSIDDIDVDEAIYFSDVDIRLAIPPNWQP